MSRRGSIRAVSFDVGGTLVEPWPSVGHVYAAVAREFGLTDCDPDRISAQFKQAWSARGLFTYSRACWAKIVAQSLGLACDTFGPEEPLFCRVYDRFAEADAWRIYDDVRPALEGLKRRGLRLAVISNWDDRLRTLLANLRLGPCFAAIEVSVESGFHKPAPEIFRRALERLGLPPEAVLHVGDSLAEDVAGAEGVGMPALLVDRKQAAEGRRIRGLEEVIGWVDGSHGG